MHVVGLCLRFFFEQGEIGLGPAVEGALDVSECFRCICEAAGARWTELCIVLFSTRLLSPTLPLNMHCISRCTSYKFWFDRQNQFMWYFKLVCDDVKFQEFGVSFISLIAIICWRVCKFARVDKIL